MENFIDGLLTSEDFKSVVNGSEVQFYKTYDSCLLHKFVTTIQDTDNKDIKLNEFKYIITDSILPCFFSNSGSSSNLKSAINRLEDSSHLATQSFLHYITIKIIEGAVINKLISDIDLDKLVIKLYEAIQTKGIQNVDTYYKVHNMAQEIQTDLILDYTYKTTASKTYSELKNLDIVSSIYYTYQYNKYLRLYGTLEYIAQAKYLVTKDLSIENTAFLKVIDSKIDPILNITDVAIKEAIAKTASKFIGIEEYLNAVKGGYKVLSGYEDLDNIILNSYENNVYSEMLDNPYVIKDVLRYIDEYLESIVNPQFLNEVYSAKDMVKNPLVFTDGVKLLNETKTSINIFPSSTTQKNVDFINNLTSLSDEDLLTKDNLDLASDSSFQFRELANSSKTSAIDSGSSLYYGSDKTSASKSLLHNAETLNQGFTDSLSSMNGMLTSNQQQIGLSIGALLGLQDRLMSMLGSYNSNVAILQGFMDMIASLLNELKQVMCILSSMLCFIKTLGQRLELTKQGIIGSYNDTLRNINEQKEKLVGMWNIFKDTFTSEVDKELLKQVREIVRPKVLPLAMLVDTSRYEAVQNALNQAIDDTINNDSSRGSFYNDLINEIKGFTQSIIDSIYGSYNEATDTNRCKCNPLFEMPNMLSFNIDGLSFRKSMLDGLDFSTTNCKV